MLKFNLIKGSNDKVKSKAKKQDAKNLATKPTAVDLFIKKYVFRYIEALI